MNNRYIKMFNRIYPFLMAALTLLVGAFLVFACASIYFDGEGFSRRAVLNGLKLSAIPFVLWSILLLVGFFVPVLGKGTVKKSSEHALRMNLSRLYERLDMKTISDDNRCLIRRESIKRRLWLLLTIAVALISFFVFVFYALRDSAFELGPGINKSIVQACLVMSACLIFPFAFAVVGSIETRKSLMRETEMVKRVYAGNKKTLQLVENKQSKTETFIKVALILAGLFLLTYGISNGGTRDVLAKAVNICTECIGLG